MRAPGVVAVQCQVGASVEEFAPAAAGVQVSRDLSVFTVRELLSHGSRGGQPERQVRGRIPGGGLRVPDDEGGEEGRQARGEWLGIVRAAMLARGKFGWRGWFAGRFRRNRAVFRRVA